MVRRARYRDEYPLGYHMSNHIRSQAYGEEKSLENYMALYIAIVKDVTSDKALELMGLKPLESYKKRTTGVKTPIIAEAAYILIHVCGVLQKDVCKTFHVSAETVRNGLRGLGYKADLRNSRTEGSIYDERL